MKHSVADMYDDCEEVGDGDGLGSERLESAGLTVRFEDGGNGKF